MVDSLAVFAARIAENARRETFNANRFSPHNTFRRCRRRHDHSQLIVPVTSRVTHSSYRYNDKLSPVSKRESTSAAPIAMKYV